MRYALTRLALNSSACTAISAEEYDEFRRATRCLSEILHIEEKFDLVIGNYLELEENLLSIAARSMLGRQPLGIEMRKELNLIINRRFLNLLSSCRGYLDQTEHHLSAISKFSAKRTGNLVESFSLQRNKEYDRCFGYRLMEALRNYTQHRGFPFSIIYHSQWLGESDDPNRKMVVTITPLIEIERLKLEKKFKRAVFEELLRLGTKIDTKPLIRSYVASLGTIHENLRGLLSEDVQFWESKRAEIVNNFTRQYPRERLVGLYAAKFDNKMTIVEQIPYSHEMVEYRRHLEQSNSGLNTLARRYVTGESIK